MIINQQQYHHKAQLIQDVILVGIADNDTVKYRQLMTSADTY